MTDRSTFSNRNPSDNPASDARSPFLSTPLDPSPFASTCTSYTTALYNAEAVAAVSTSAATIRPSNRPNPSAATATTASVLLSPPRSTYPVFESARTYSANPFASPSSSIGEAKSLSGGVMRAPSSRSSANRPPSLAGSMRPYTPPRVSTATMATTSSSTAPAPPPSRPRAKTPIRSTPAPPISSSSAALHSSPSSLAAAALARKEQLALDAAALAHFASLCRQLYTTSDSTAARSISTLLAALPARQRTTYARTMARERAEVHRRLAKEQRRRIERLLERVHEGETVRAALGIGQSIAAGAGSNSGSRAMRSGKARKVRAREMAQFVGRWGKGGEVRAEPFLRGLWEVLRAQSGNGSGNNGGSDRGKEECLVEWTVDVEVFSSGDIGWEEAAVKVLKGVLGFSERIKPDRPDSYFDNDDAAVINTNISNSVAVSAAAESLIITSSSLPPPSSLPIARSKSVPAPVLTEPGSTAITPPSTFPLHISTASTPRTTPPALDSDVLLLDSDSDDLASPIAQSPSQSTASPFLLSSSSSPITAASPFVPSTSTSPVTDRAQSNSFGSARARAASDPFLDPAERRLNRTGTRTFSNPLSSPTMMEGDGEAEERATFGTTMSEIVRPALPPRPAMIDATSSSPSRSTITTSVAASLNVEGVEGGTGEDALRAVGNDDDDGEDSAFLLPQYRIFTVAPYLTDPELDVLCRLFPEHRTWSRRANLAAAAAASRSRAGKKDRVDLEAATMSIAGGGSMKGSERLANVGHGEIARSVEERQQGWRGTKWERFCFWWRRAFSRT